MASDLLDYCATDRQREVLAAWVDCGESGSEAAKALDVTRGTVTAIIGRIRRRAAKSGHPGLTEHIPEGYHLAQLSTQVDKDGEVKSRSIKAKPGIPEVKPTVPDGHTVKGLSSLVNADGEVVAQWVKTGAKQQTPESMLEAMDRALADWDGPRPEPVGIPVDSDADLLTVYPMGDPHIGMLSWAPETGADFDLDIAEHNLTTATQQLVGMSPPSSEAIILNLGDFFHADDQKNATPNGGNQLDVDGRQGKIIDAGIRIMVTCIQAALGKHAAVRVVNVRGNHDPSSALWLARCLQQRYVNEPRVTVDTSPSFYGRYLFGCNLLGWTHGHGAKIGELPGLMASTWPEDWGRAKFRKWHIGHFHHKDRKSHNGCITEIYATLAGRDGWHAMKGYLAERNMVAEVYHRTKGPRRSYQINLEEVESA